MRLKIAIVIVALALGLGFLIVSSSSEESRLHFTLVDFKNTLAETPQKIEGRFMTVYGTVKEGTIQRNGTRADFFIEDEGQQLKIHFTGKTLLPDAFKDGAKASIDGTYDAASQTFMADKILAKCASKYDAAAEYKKNY